MTTQPLDHLTEAKIRQELRGFPDRAVETLLALKRAPTESLFERAVLEILTFYLPSGIELDLTRQAPSTRLREDLGVDSLTFAEAAFKLEELFDVRIENDELNEIKTIADLRGFAGANLFGGVAL